MRNNLGNLDRIIRAAVGIAAIIAGFVFQSWWGLIGVVLLLTGIIGWCPLYSVLGLKTVTKTHPQKV